MRAYGQKLVKCCTLTHTLTHAAKLVVKINVNGGTIYVLKIYKTFVYITFYIILQLHKPLYCVGCHVAESFLPHKRTRRNASSSY